jgi:hypothetical protein
MIYIQFIDDIYVVLLHTGWMLQSKSSKGMFLVYDDFNVYANTLDKINTNPDGKQVSFLMKPCLAPNAPVARCVSFQPENQYQTGHYLRHSAYFLASAWIGADASAAFNASASFIMNPDKFNTGYVAFQSVNEQDRYIRIQKGAGKVQVKIEVDDYTTNFRDDASFVLVARPDPWPPVA